MKNATLYSIYYHHSQQATSVHLAPLYFLTLDDNARYLKTYHRHTEAEACCYLNKRYYSLLQSLKYCVSCKTYFFS